MKFQSIFVLFNILLVIFLAILCLAPVFLLRGGLASVFWQSNWILILLLAMVLAGFDLFYLANRQLYALLEKEDWPALVTYLEDRIIRKGKYSERLVRLLANTYLVLSDSPGVISLENKAAMAKPSLVDKNALVFGTARILGKDISGAVRFFESRLNTVKPGLRQWVQWYYGFTLLLEKQFEKSSEEFSSLSMVSNDGVITGLSAFFLGNTLVKSLPEKIHFLGNAAAQGRSRVTKALPRRKDWNRETARISAEIHGAVLTKYMEEAGQWLYQ